MEELILASQSPRRQELLKLLGHPFTCIPSNIEESILPGESPSEHVTRLAESKAHTIGKTLTHGIVIGSDTIVVLHDYIFGKPSSQEEALEMLMKLQGNTHTVYTGFALFHAMTKDMVSDFEISYVTMREISVELAKKYIATKEPLDKAGAYGIQGYGAALITSIQGCFFNVMGLPLARVMDALITFSHGQFDYFGRKSNQHKV